MKKIDYDERLYAEFHEGRALAESAMRLWQQTLRRCIGDRNGLTILDLGSGTGRFSCMLADEFVSHVIGVEPSDKMREVAEAGVRHPRVRFVAGSAATIPLSDDSCDVAWLSQVLHHVPDIAVAARELSRVLRKSGQVVIRSNFKGRLEGSCRYYDFFPQALIVDEARHPTVEHVTQCFERNGFRVAVFETIEQIEAGSLREYAERIRLRTYSSFELISNHDFEAGMSALDEAASRERQPQPVMAKIDLLVFHREGRGTPERRTGRKRVPEDL